MIRPTRAPRRLPVTAHESGQAALGLVTLLVVMLLTGSVILATNAVQNDPLVEGDALQHYAYRGLEAGMNSYINTINAQPDLVNCSTATTTTKTTSACYNGVTQISYDTWHEVPLTTQSQSAIPEYYLWTNPQFCFSTTQSIDTACTTKSTSGNLESVQLEIVGAAGSASRWQYESSLVNFEPSNSFLTHLWWSNYESTDPALKTTTKTAAKDCTWDWNNSYDGPNISPHTYCSAVYFAAGDVIDGPVYSNDSIYATTGAAFGTKTGTHPTAVQTADPKCLFVSQVYTGPSNCASASTATTGGVAGKFTKTNSKYGLARETPPQTDSELKVVAEDYGCLYNGPTTISFGVAGGVGYMNVTSPETPRTGSHDNDNATTNNSKCLGTKLTFPTATTHDVLFVETSTVGTDGTGTCTNNKDNPLDGFRQGMVKTTKTTGSGIYSQILASGDLTGTSHGFDLTDDISKVNPDCMGDAFVRDATNKPTGETPGISGRITVGAQNNVMITGNLKYSDCGSSFDSQNNCTYNTGATAVNDSLGLIATNYVELNRPLKPSCNETTTTTRTTVHHTTKTTSAWACSTHQKLLTTTKTPPHVLAKCASTVTTLKAVLCDPGPTVIIDAAILALQHSFAVDNYTVARRTTGGTVKSVTTGHLTIYGVIDQDYRGAVGTFSSGTLSTGYSKQYLFDGRLQYVAVPSYLTPGTPSWTVASSGAILSYTCPAWPKPFPSGGLTTKGKNPLGTTC